MDDLTLPVERKRLHLKDTKAEDQEETQQKGRGLYKSRGEAKAQKRKCPRDARVWQSEK